MFSRFSLTTLSAIAQPWTLCPSMSALLTGVKEILMFTGASGLRAALTDGVAHCCVIATGETDDNACCSLGLKCSSFKGDRSIYDSLPCCDLLHQPQHWLLYIVLKAVRGSSFRVVERAYFDASKVLGISNLAISSICELGKYLGDLEFERNSNADVDVKQPKSGRYSFSSIPA